MLSITCCVGSMYCRMVCLNFGFRILDFLESSSKTRAWPVQDILWRVTCKHLLQILLFQKQPRFRLLEAHFLDFKVSLFHFLFFLKINQDKGRSEVSILFGGNFQLSSTPRHPGPPAFGSVFGPPKYTDQTPNLRRYSPGCLGHRIPRKNVMGT